MLVRWVILLSAGMLLLGGCAASSQRGVQSAEVTSVVATETAEPDFDADFSDFDTDFDPDFADFDADFEGWDAPGTVIADPFEPFNRGVFWVNDKLYFYLFKPVARGYRVVVPRPARVSVGNFFSNLATPVRAGNALLQLKFTNLGTEVYRFIVNSSLGVVGLFDPAADIAGVRRVHGDFGQTLGYYGVGHGFYLVLPIVGASSLRDGTGSFVDSFADPLRYSGLDTGELLAVKLYDATNRLSLDRDTYEAIVRDSLDPYLFVRAAYAQRRRAQVGEGVSYMNLFRAPLFDRETFNPIEWFRLQ